MGGLRKQMPVTFFAMSISAAALAGLPLTSGFLSKDALLITSFEWAQGYHGLKMFVPYVLTFTSWLTVFYIARMIFKVFFGKSRFESIKEAPAAMRRILEVLIFFSIFPVFSFRPFSYASSWVLNGFSSAGVKRVDYMHLIVPAFVTFISVVIIIVAYKIYGRSETKVFRDRGFLYRFSNNAWYFDSVYNFMFVRSVKSVSRFSSKFDILIVDGLVNMLARLMSVLSGISDWLDRNIIDGLVNGIAIFAGKAGKFSRQFQSGKLQHYLITMISLMLIFFIITYFI